MGGTAGWSAELQLVAAGGDGDDDAAVDQQIGAGDKTAVAAHQEGSGRTDLVRGADAAGG
jgi:hypothetical protein